MSHFFRIKDKAQALREIEQNCKAVELMRHRVRFEGSQGETLWAFLGLCADYATAKDVGFELGYNEAVRRGYIANGRK